MVATRDTSGGLPVVICHVCRNVFWEKQETSLWGNWVYGMIQIRNRACENKERTMCVWKLNTRQKNMKEKNQQYQEFCDMLKTNVLSNPVWNVKPEDYTFYPDGYAGEDQKDKNFVSSTNMKYHGIVSDVLKGDFIALNLRTGGESECMCRFSMEYLYSEYEEEGWDKVNFILQENISLAMSTNVDYILEHLTEYEIVKNRLMIRAINCSDYTLRLDDYIYRVYGDIALVLYVVLYDDQRGLGGIKIPREMVECWNKEENFIFEEALINTYTHAQPRLYTNLWDTIKTPIKRGAFMSINSDVNAIEKFQVPLVTTTKKMNGAIAMFYPGVKEKIAELFGGSYYIAFTSIHEARIHHCDSISPRMIQESLQDINAHFNPTEVLSRFVFRYDADKKTLVPLTWLKI